MFPPENSTDDTGAYSLLLLREEELQQAGMASAHDRGIAVNYAANAAFITLAAVIPVTPILIPMTD